VFKAWTVLLGCKYSLYFTGTVHVWANALGSVVGLNYVGVNGYQFPEDDLDSNYTASSVKMEGKRSSKQVVILTIYLGENFELQAFLHVKKAKREARDRSTLEFSTSNVMIIGTRRSRSNHKLADYLLTIREPWIRSKTVDTQ